MGLYNTPTASLQKGKAPFQRVSWYDTKQSDGEAPEFWGMLSSSSLPLLLGQLWSGLVAPDRALSMGQIELNSVFTLNWIIWNRTVFVYSNELFEMDFLLTLNLCAYGKLNCLK